ncbi:MAG: hypothetical protein IKO10_15020 [Lachnospiraceae bacterium]|nr:hypothetical protein [Lachnospiraceae bacterium]
MKNEIKYSEQDIESVTRMMDHIMDYRDEFLFQTLFKGYKNGYIKEAEYDRKKTYRIKLTVVALLFILIVCRYKYSMEYGVDPLTPITDTILLGLVMLALYFGLVFPHSVRLMQHEDWYKCRPLWEERADRRFHIMSRPVLIGVYAIGVKNRIRKQLLAYRLQMDLYDCAFDLNMLRCLCVVSAGIKQFVEHHGEASTKIELVEKKRETKADSPDDVYRILLTVTSVSAEETVVPVETDAKATEIVLPYGVGKVLDTIYEEKKCLDLSVLDASYSEILDKIYNLKKDIKIQAKDLGLYKDSSLLRG